MLVDWTFLIAAVVALWLPAGLLHSSQSRTRLASARSSRFRIERMVSAWQHWVDLLRGGMGTWVLMNKALLPGALEAEGMYLYYAAVAAILTIAVVLQTVNRKEYFYFTAPVFFLFGVSFGLVAWIPVAFAIVFSTILSRMGNYVDLVFPLMACLVGIVGYFVDGLTFNLVIACGLLMLPLLLTYASMSHLVCYTRVAADA